MRAKKIEKKKWQLELEAQQQQQAERAEEKDNEKQQDQTQKQQSKQFAWMSDSDEPIKEQEAPKKKEQEPEQEPVDVFLKQIPQKATEEDVQKFLSKFGKVVQLYMPTNEGTQIHKGKAFIKMIVKNVELFTNEQKIKGNVVEIRGGHGVENKERTQKSRSRSRSRQRIA